MNSQTISDATGNGTILKRKAENKEDCKNINTIRPIKYCVTKSSNCDNTNNQLKTNVSDNDENIYGRLLALQDENIVLYPMEFDCSICLEKCVENEGVILKECLHFFCKDCVRLTAINCEGIDVKCPYRDDNYSCTFFLQEKEIEALLSPEEYRGRLKRSLEHVEINLNLAFHCRKPDCGWWCVNDQGKTSIQCPVCLSTNCVPCRAIHSGITCTQYAARSTKFGDSETELVKMVLQGTAMFCPQCSTVVEKVDGCDALICAFCKTALCWATKGRRWGPKGCGDISGGCKCRVNGIKCHVDCCGCH